MKSEMRARRQPNVHCAQPVWRAVVALACTSLMLCGGCGGCGSSSAVEGQADSAKSLSENRLGEGDSSILLPDHPADGARRKIGTVPAGSRKSQRPKPPFETFKVFTEPNEKSFTEPTQKDAGRTVQAIKPGHWASMLVETKANLFDFSGELLSLPLDSRQDPVTLDHGPFYLVTSREASLAKGQRKTLEALFFAPRTRHTTTQISNRLDNARQGAESQAFGEILSHMPAYQYFMIVLARDPHRYQSLKVLESVRPIGETMPLNPQDAAYYRLVMPDLGQPAALSTQSLCWTSVAYVVWDDASPTALASRQQQALLDWLHWGGGLIVSGPQTLEALRGTFLESYLPATAAETTRLEASSLAELNAHWTLTDERGARQPLHSAAPWSAVRLQKHPQAEFVDGTGQLVVERRVGRGRIVVTAFRLTEPELWNWRSFDSFFNACLLRRPPRTFDAARAQFEFVGRDDRLDPALATNVRYFTRDAQNPDEGSRPLPPDAARGAKALPDATARPDAASGWPHMTDPTDIFKTRSGVAAWDDFNWISSLARHTLREAAGISVPKREFVLSMLGIYLLLVVPVNWIVFRLMGRVEWAWFAVPVLALGWGGAVIWLAQLDIGFARAETELGILEVQNGFPRGHLTRYTAVYTSLSTNYDIHFAHPSALAQPFATDVERLRDQQAMPVTLRDATDRQLTGLIVSSNATGLIHSEQMFDLGGDLRWTAADGRAARLENNTQLALVDVAVLRRRPGDDDQVVDEMAWLGDVAAGAQLDVEFGPRDQRTFNPQRAAMRAGAARAGELDLWRLVEATANFDSLEPGDVRLVARCAGGLEGVRIEPAAAQARRATLVIANLEFAKGPSPRPDFNLRALEPAGDAARAADPATKPPRLQRPLNNGTGSEPAGNKPLRNQGREVPVAIFQHAAQP